jgi:hypothetical protein
LEKDKMPYLYLYASAVEGFPDKAVVSAICRSLNITVEESRIYVKRGKSNLDGKIAGYNNSAKGNSWLILRDMDHDASCPPELRDVILPTRSEKMLLVIAEREVESWLLGDPESLSNFLGVGIRNFPHEPEAIEDPKKEVLRIAQRSRRREIREDMVPRPESGAKEGPLYASRLAEFAAKHWRPKVAAKKCKSLAYCIERLKTLCVIE